MNSSFGVTVYVPRRFAKVYVWPGTELTKEYIEGYSKDEHPSSWLNYQHSPFSHLEDEETKSECLELNVQVLMLS
jgi:hypothetical protein